MNGENDDAGMRIFGDPDAAQWRPIVNVAAPSGHAAGDGSTPSAGYVPSAPLRWLSLPVLWTMAIWSGVREGRGVKATLWVMTRHCIKWCRTGEGT